MITNVLSTGTVDFKSKVAGFPEVHTHTSFDFGHSSYEAKEGDVTVNADYSTYCDGGTVPHLSCFGIPADRAVFRFRHTPYRHSLLMN